MFPKITDAAEAYRKRIFPGRQPAMGPTDPEYVELFENFLFDEVVNCNDLDDRTRFIAIVSSLIGCKSYEAIKSMASAALEAGVTPVELKEIVYQASAYVGVGGSAHLLPMINELLKHRGLDLQLEPQGTTDDETRRAAGNAVQVEIFGEQMRESWEHCPEDRKLINSWLAEYCFGSFYTRTGLSLADRELVAFCILAGMGFVEKQLDAHIQGNLNVGNDRELLIKVTMQIMPYIGFPRTLNTLDAIDRVCPAE